MAFRLQGAADLSYFDIWAKFDHLQFPLSSRRRKRILFTQAQVNTPFNQFEFAKRLVFVLFGNQQRSGEDCWRGVLNFWQIAVSARYYLVKKFGIGWFRILVRYLV